MDADTPLFPRLDRKKTRLMVNKDLERIGMAYETPEGIAAFHAAGRHSHITGLVRHGATLVEAKELARHGFAQEFSDKSILMDNWGDQENWVFNFVRKKKSSDRNSINGNRKPS